MNTQQSKAHATVVRRMQRFRVRYDRATTALQQLEDERAELYEAARQLDPPMTFREIAAVFEITEAAVMQKMRRRAKAS